MMNGTGTNPEDAAAVLIRAPDDMVRIGGGTFRMGSDVHYPEERPAHDVTVDSFWIDQHAVTNADFAAFVSATGYITFAERPLDPALYPGAKPELLTHLIHRTRRPRCHNVYTTAMYTLRRRLT
jgi:formylglycine-generating enzyme required for sulfatase activity